MVNISNIITKNKNRRNTSKSKSKTDQTSGDCNISVVTCPVSNVSEEGRRERASSRRSQPTSSSSSQSNMSAVDTMMTRENWQTPIPLPTQRSRSQPVDLDEMMDTMAVEQQYEYDDAVSQTETFDTVPLSAHTQSFNSYSSETTPAQKNRNYLPVSSSINFDSNHNNSNNNSNSQNNRNMVGSIEHRLHHLGWLYHTRSARS